MKKILLFILLIYIPIFATDQLAIKENIIIHIKKLESLENRNIMSKNNSKASEYIIDQLTLNGYKPTKDYFKIQNQKFYNVLSNSSDKDKPIIILSAHFDSISYVNNQFYDKAPGADDNASGVAALLELSRILKSEKYNIEFVFFNSEENQTLGSRHLAELCKNNLFQIKYMINIDTIGTWRGNISKENPVNYVSDEKSMILINSMLRSFPLPMRKAKELWLDDHGNFWKKGYIAIEITEDGVTDNMHKPTDTSDKLNYTYSGETCHLFRF